MTINSRSDLTKIRHKYSFVVCCLNMSKCSILGNNCTADRQVSLTHISMPTLTHTQELPLRERNVYCPGVPTLHQPSKIPGHSRRSACCTTLLLESTGIYWCKRTLINDMRLRMFTRYGCTLQRWLSWQCQPLPCTFAKTLSSQPSRTDVTSADFAILPESTRRFTHGAWVRWSVCQTNAISFKRANNNEYDFRTLYMYNRNDVFLLEWMLTNRGTWKDTNFTVEQDS